MPNRGVDLPRSIRGRIAPLRIIRDAALWELCRYRHNGHSTGHASRLERFTEAPAPFGSADYSREELIAELGAAFLCSEAGIAPPVIENQAAYLAGWLKALKTDRRAIVVAAAQAERAADLILNRILQED